MVRQVRDLARILSHEEPLALGLLRCFGVFKINVAAAAPQNTNSYMLCHPTWDQPSTLRGLLFKAFSSLNTMFRLAEEMARGVASTHAACFVHKCFTPEYEYPGG